jgi:hypothetical protein
MLKLSLAIVGALLLSTSAIAFASPGAPRPTATAAAGGLTAGSSGHPQGLRLTMTFGWHGLAEADQPTVVGLDIWFPKGSVYNGARYPICSRQMLDARGPAGCPKGSIMGSGTGTAYADTTITRPSITVVNGGATIVYFYTVLNNPARVQEPIVGHITRLPGNFTYHLTATIPENLRVVAGVPIKLTDLEVTAGGGDWLATTNAPAGIKVQTTFDNGASVAYQVWVQDS